MFIPLPGVDRAAFQTSIQNNAALQFVNLFAGGGLGTLGIFALGILPYINASIIIQLLTAAIPQLEDLQKNEGEAGRRKLLPRRRVGVQGGRGRPGPAHRATELRGREAERTEL